MPTWIVSSRSRTAYVLMSFLGLMMIGVAATVMGPAFPFILKEFAIPLGVLGVLASSWNVGYLLTPIGGIISDRYGEPVVLVASFAAIGAAVGLASRAPNYLALLGVFLVAGIGSAFGEVSMNSLVTKAYPNRSGFALNALHLFFSIGAFIGPALAGLLIVTYGSWRLPYLIACLVFVPLAAAAAMLLRRTKSEKRVVISEAERSHMPEGKILEALMQGRALLLAGFFYFGAELGANAWLPTFLMLERGFPVGLASLSIGLFWASMAAGRLGLGSLTDKVGYRKLIVTCASLSGLSILIATLVGDSYLIIAFWCFSGFAFGPIMPTILAWGAALFPSRRGVATGAIYSIGFLGAVFSPWFLGTVGDLYNLGISALYLPFSTFMIALSAMMLGKVRR
ncbi:MAG: MFS transporter [Candidatus Bathyarchaeia archaeon]